MVRSVEIQHFRKLSEQLNCQGLKAGTSFQTTLLDSLVARSDSCNSQLSLHTVDRRQLKMGHDFQPKAYSYKTLEVNGRRKFIQRRKLPTKLNSSVLSLER